jgi:hypothetical protein
MPGDMSPKLSNRGNSITCYDMAFQNLLSISLLLHLLWSQSLELVILVFIATETINKISLLTLEKPEAL